MKKIKKENRLSREQIRLLLQYEWLQKSLPSQAASKINSAYGEKTVTRQTASNWFNRFEANEMSLKDKKHTGRPQEIDRKQVIDEITENPTLTTAMLGDHFGCSSTAIKNILHEAAKISPSVF